MPAGADAGDEDIEPLREIGEDLPRGGGGMNVDIDGIFELLGNPGPGILRGSSSARAIAPFMPFSRGVRSKVAP